VNIFLRVVRTRPEFEAALDEWLTGNNTQFLYVGAHGATHGIGSSNSDFMSWQDLGDRLQRSVVTPVVWLGACYSSSAAVAWSGRAGRPPAAWLTTFSTGVYPRICERMVQTSLGNARMEHFIFVDEELPSLRATAGPLVDLFYPVREGAVVSYVHAESFPQRVGRSLREYLQDGHHEDW
jgi:hypothetical protein